MNFTIINRNEIRLRTETADEYIRLTSSGNLAVLRSVRTKRNLVGKGVATVVVVAFLEFCPIGNFQKTWGDKQSWL